MSNSTPAPTNRASRRTKFRDFMKAFNPTAPAQSVIEAGLVYLDLHRSLYANLAGRADLEPGSQQLLVGGIGSGKTTELLLAVKWLREQGNVLPLYIDITAETNLSALNSGSLLASFGSHLSLQFSKSGSFTQDQLDTLKKIREFAYGKTQRVWVSADDEDYGPDPSDFDDEEREGYYHTHAIPGKLQPPLPALNRDLHEIFAPLHKLLTMAREGQKDIVVVFDGLDRLLVPDKFHEVAYQDLRVLRQLNVSVLATAPISILYGIGRSVSELFDRVQHLPALLTDPKDGFLLSVLKQRGGLHLMSEHEAETLCAFSGGVLRDLISLCRDAAEEAYISDHERIIPADVEKVAGQLGSAYLRGLGPDSIKVLLDLEKTKNFNVELPANVELLVTRRVLEYSSMKFKPHPALLSFLQATGMPNA